jgi:hypothetical protein
MVIDQQQIKHSTKSTATAKSSRRKNGASVCSLKSLILLSHHQIQIDAKTDHLHFTTNRSRRESGITFTDYLLINLQT